MSFPCLSLTEGSLLESFGSLVTMNPTCNGSVWPGRYTLLLFGFRIVRISPLEQTHGL